MKLHKHKWEIVEKPQLLSKKFHVQCKVCGKKKYKKVNFYETMKNQGECLWCKKCGHNLNVDGYVYTTDTNNTIVQCPVCGNETEIDKSIVEEKPKNTIEIDLSKQENDKPNGFILCLEGPDGIGKTTIAKSIVDKMKFEYNTECIYLKEPGSTVAGEKIRELLFELGQDIEPLTQTCLFSASRVELFNKAIIPYIKEGKIIILDRFILSNMVYQGNISTSLKIFNDILSKIDDVNIEMVTLYLTADKELINSRLNGREEKNSYDNIQGIYEQYERLYKVNSITNIIPGQVIKLDITNTNLEQNVNYIINNIINNYLNKESEVKDNGRE